MTDHSAVLDRRSYLAHVKQYLPSNPELELLEALIDDDHPAFGLRYRFGEHITSRGVFKPPCPKCAPCRTLKSRFTRALQSIPLGLVCSNTAEVFLDSADPATVAPRPLRLLGPGELFGVFETLDVLFDEEHRKAPWSVVAGARSVVALLSRRTQIENLIKRELSTRESSEDYRKTARVYANDDWQLLRYIASIGQSNAAGETPYETRIIVFAPLADRPMGETLQRQLPALHQIDGIGWLQSKNLRERAMDTDHLAANDFLAKANVPREDRVPLQKVAQHVLAAARGDLPTFVSAARPDVVRAVPLNMVKNTLNRWMKTEHALVLQPHHLKRGDVAFISIKANANYFSAEAGKKPSRGFLEFSIHCMDFLRALQPPDLDLSGTEFIDGPEAVLELLSSDAIDLENEAIPTRHPFLTACLKVARRA